MAADQTDREHIIRAAAAGDPAAFSTLQADYRPLVESTVRRFLSTIPEMREEDLLQEAWEAFLKAVRNYKQDQKQVTFGLYAQIVLRNRMISLFRNHKTRRKVRPLPSALPHPRPPEEKVLTAEEREQQLLKYRAVLSPYEMQVFRLRLEGEKTGAIAVRLGRNPKSVDNALSRLKAKIKQIADLADPNL